MAVQSYTAYLLLAFILLLEAEVFNLVKAQGKYDCQKLDELEYCRNSSRIRVTKDKKDYRVRFCANNVDECMSDMVGDMNLKIKCSDVCDVCKSLPGEKDCKEPGNCEEQVDKFFEDYCSSANTATTFEELPGTSTVECTPPSPSQVIGSQVSPESILQSATGDASGSESLVVALGALLGLSMLLLAVVTTGWVCTCVSMKKRVKSDNPEVIESTQQNRTASESTHKDKNDEDDDDDEERYFKNPTYEGTSNKNNSSTSSPTYETVNLSDSTKITIENEQAYAVPDKQWQANGTYIF